MPLALKTQEQDVRQILCDVEAILHHIAESKILEAENSEVLVTALTKSARQLVQDSIEIIDG
ncbi:hypothetical protein RE428_32210 [Marinobacter nanhaiticus D15-8W]|uniref:Uncharacterized protein n=1 Tax=Marinobacter nanhaiticus D15-8W TaxID=626887 RepID=N6X702_9GAMM|nr:hypothetical protein [Marinobacter nanhaiticus]ENO16913.1 hypothetical protein J057_01875 [Marinobacter nanhaiticus D15-8W]BES72203.1 hypothetical protein RE428_32210 [Marinobacter nanhaiticus D15-8W]